MLITVYPQAIQPSEISSAMATDAEVSDAIAAHVAASDPHPVYLTQTEGDARYRQTATALTDADIPSAIARDSEVAAAIATHGAAADPHPIYLNQTEGDARYLQLTGGMMSGRVFNTGGLAASTSIANVNGSLGAFEARSQGSGTSAGAAFICFHRPGNFATYLGLDTDNQLKVGGWSYGAAAYRIHHDGNLNFDNIPATIISRGTFASPSSSGLNVTGASGTDGAFLKFVNPSYGGDGPVSSYLGCGGYFEGYGTLVFNGFRVFHSGLNYLSLKSWTYPAVPAASGIAGALIYVSNATGGARICYSDGSNWRRINDNTILN